MSTSVSEINDDVQKKRELSPSLNDTTTLLKKSRMDTLFDTPVQSPEEEAKYSYIGAQSPVRDTMSSNWTPSRMNAPMVDRHSSWLDRNYGYNHSPSDHLRSNNNNNPQEGGSSGVFHDLFGVEHRIDDEDDEDEDEYDYVEAFDVEDDDEMRKERGSSLFQRSLYNELLLNSNNTPINPKENNIPRRNSIFASIFEDDFERISKDQQKSVIKEEEEEEEEGETDNYEEKTTLPLTRHTYNDEVDAFFSSHNPEDEPDEYVLSSSYKMKILRRQHQRGPPWITDWPHFLTTEYFENYGPEDRTIPDDEKERRQPIPEGAMFTHYFDAKFPILGKIDIGEFSEVWKARCPVTNELCAVKKSKSIFTNWDDRWQQLIEVENLRKVKGSEHCIELMNAWEERGFLFIQLEFCPGASLEKYIKFKKRQIDENIVWKIFYEIVLGVQDIHQANIAHLDLKPSNILIAKDGCIKITDFGISVQIPANMKWVKGEGDRRYMAPDLLRENFDKPADIFSLGLILLELSTGIILPDADETWELLRIGDFSKQKKALSKVSLEMSEMIEWLLTTEAKERPTIKDIMSHPSFVKIDNMQKKEKTYVLASYLDELNNAEAEREAQKEAELLRKIENGEYGLSTPVDRIF